MATLELPAQETSMRSSPDVDHDKISNSSDAEVNIAIVGKTGSGRSSFINAIMGYDGNNEKEMSTRESTEKTRKYESKPISYSHGASPNVKFTILPRIDKECFPAFDRYLKCVENYEYDAYLIFTAEKFGKRHLFFARRVEEKPLFFIRTKVDSGHTEALNEEDVFYRDIRASLAKDLKTLKSVQCGKCEIYLVSNRQQEKWDFDKLMKAIAGSLSHAKKECFRKSISKIQEFIVEERFNNFIKEKNDEEMNENETEPLLGIDDIKKLFAGSGVAGVQRTIRKNLEKWREVKINLAILGNSGTGKSSFINAIRGVDDGHAFAANTGVVESTDVPTAYQHPTNPNIVFWDLPGIGTEKFPNLEVFGEKVHIDKYDTYLIICASRITSNDVQLANEVRSLGKSFFFIRTKIDNDIASDERKWKSAFNEMETLRTIRDDCESQIQNAQFCEQKVFLISSYHRTKWDFDNLKKAIVDQLPSKQKESLVMTLRTQSIDILREKIKILKGRTRFVALASVGAKICLGPLSLYVDTKLIKSTVKLYCTQLAFPETNSREFEKLPKELQEKVERFHPKVGEEYIPWLKSFDPSNVYNIRMKMGMTITNNTLKFVHGMLNMVLDEMEKTALAIFKVGAGMDAESESEAESDTDKNEDEKAESGADVNEEVHEEA